MLTSLDNESPESDFVKASMRIARNRFRKTKLPIKIQDIK
jgi:hypothetical protein